MLEHFGFRWSAFSKIVYSRNKNDRSLSHQHVTFFSFSLLQNFFKDLKEFIKTSEAKKYLILFEI